MRSLLGTLAAATLLMSGLAAPGAEAARPPVLSAQDAQVVEGPGAVAYVRVVLARKHGRVTVRWRTKDGTAVAGADYVAAGGKLRFGKKPRTKLIAVRLVDDARTEPDETFGLVLRKANGARLKDATAVVTIAASDIPPPDPVLRVARSGDGAGYVRTDPAIDGLEYCQLGEPGPGCVASMPRGTSVTVWIEPHSSATFDGWTATPGCTGTDPCTVVVEADTTLTAAMTALPGTFVARLVGAGHLSVTGALDDGCDATFTYCEGSIANGAPDATVTVHKDDPDDILLWSGDAPCAQDVLSCTIRAGRELVATIVEPTQTVTVTAGGGGAGTVTGPGIVCSFAGGALSGDCTEDYDTGTSVTLSATPGAGSQVWQLSFPPCGVAGTFTTPVACTSTVTSPTTVFARFETG